MIEETKLKGYCSYDNDLHTWKVGATDLDDIMSQFIGNEITITIRNKNSW